MGHSSSFSVIKLRKTTVTEIYEGKQNGYLRTFFHTSSKDSKKETKSRKDSVLKSLNRGVTDLEVRVLSRISHWVRLLSF